MNYEFAMNAVNAANSDWGSARAAERNWEYALKQMDRQFELNQWFQEDAQNFAREQQTAQQVFSEYMWNKNNAYNSPEAQVQRMLDAGFNPYLQGVNGVGSTAPTTSAVGAGQGSVSPGAPMAGPINIPSVSSVRAQLSQAELFNQQKQSVYEDTQGKRIDNMTRNLRNIEMLRNLMSDTDSKDLKNYYQGILNYFVHDMQQQDLIGRQYTNENLRLQGASLGYSIAAQALQNSYLPEQLQLDVALKNASLFESYQRGQLTKAQYEHELVKVLISKEDLKQEKVDTDIAEDTARDQKNAIRADAAQKSLDYNTARRMAKYIIKKSDAEAQAAWNNRHPRDAWQESFDGGFGGILYRRTLGVRDFFVPFLNFKK